MNRIVPPTPRHKRGGFTLIEVLLVTVLSAILLAGLWSLFGTYIRLFESGPERTERAQLLRALKQQFTDDLRGAIQVSEERTDTATHMTFGSSSSTTDDTDSESSAPETPAAQSRLPRFGIIGTAQSLQIVALQIPTETLNQFPEEQLPADFAEQVKSPAPELRVIRYTFTEHREMDSFDDGPPPGLLRRDVDWQTALADKETDDGGDPADDPFAAAATQDGVNDDDSITWIPEVIDIQFRYFGNGVWQSSWDSQYQKTLPSAVEIVMEMKDPLEKDEPETDAAATSFDDDLELNYEDEQSSLLGELESRNPQYRFLIHLPGGLVKPARHGGLGLPAADSSPVGGTP